ARYGDVDDAFASADRVLRERLVQHRYSNQPMETRGCVAEIDATSGAVTFHSATQNTHMVKWTLAALTGRQPIWRSLRELARQRERLAALAQRAKALAPPKAEREEIAKKLEDPIDETPDFGDARALG